MNVRSVFSLLLVIAFLAGCMPQQEPVTPTEEAAPTPEPKATPTPEAKPTDTPIQVV